MIKKVLNLYCGIGGNRALWPDEIEVVAVEHEPTIAQFYQERFPKDKVIIADAHQYLLENYMNFDFIWSSPPCPSHSTIRISGVYSGQHPALYPEMSLYQEIILLRHFAPLDSKWVVENVRPYYDVLIPSKSLGRHLFWSNFLIPSAEIEDDRICNNSIQGNSVVYGVTLPKYITVRKDKVLRNMVNPKLGEYLFNVAAGIKTEKTDQLNMFPESVIKEIQNTSANMG